MDTPKVKTCFTCAHADEPGDAHPCMGCCDTNDKWEPKEEPKEVVRDCNTCRHHKQGENSLRPRHKFTYGMNGCSVDISFRCSECLLDLSMYGELSQWEPFVDPNNNIEA